MNSEMTALLICSSLILGVIIIILLQKFMRKINSLPSVKKREEERRLEEAEKQAEKRAAVQRIHQAYSTPKEASKNGELLMKLYSDPKKVDEALHVYLDKSGKIFVVNHKSERIINVDSLDFQVVQVYNETYTYHPERTVYTGATVGGIHMGGIHTEGAHYSERKLRSGNGEVHFTIEGKDQAVLFIAVTEALLKNAGKSSPLTSLTIESGSNKTLKEFFGTGEYIIPLVNLDSSTSDMYRNTALVGGNLYHAAEMFSRAKSSGCLPMGTCRQIANELNRLIDMIAEKQEEED